MTQLIANPVAIHQRVPSAEAKCRWQTENLPDHEFLAVICLDEEEGGYSVCAPRYPGIVSQGETIEEAKENIREAFVAMLEACQKRGRPLQYSNQLVIESPPGCVHAWITVNG